MRHTAKTIQDKIADNKKNIYYVQFIIIYGIFTLTAAETTFHFNFDNN